MPQLVFLHGYGREPRDYAPFLQELGGALHVPVRADFAYGAPALRLASFARAVSWTRAALPRLLAGGDDYWLVGHSTGAAVALSLGALDPAPRAVVALNPAVRVPGWGPLFFLPRALRMTLRHARGLTGPEDRAHRLLDDTGARGARHFARNLIPNLRFLATLARVDLSAPFADGRRADYPVRVIRTTTDEFFDRCPDPDLTARFTDARIDLLEAASHEWLLVEPERATAEVLRRLNELA